MRLGYRADAKGPAPATTKAVAARRRENERWPTIRSDRVQAAYGILRCMDFNDLHAKENAAMIRIALIALALAATTTAASAHDYGRADRIDAREAAQARRIQQARRAGELTWYETLKLKAEQRRIHRMEAWAKRDGYVSRVGGAPHRGRAGRGVPQHLPREPRRPDVAAPQGVVATRWARDRKQGPLRMGWVHGPTRHAKHQGCKQTTLAPSDCTLSWLPQEAFHRRRKACRQRGTQLRLRLPLWPQSS